MSDQQIGEYAHSLILNYGAEIESEVQVTARYAPHQYQEAVERELWRKAPAHPTKGEGARDVLVWLDVLGTKREEANFLISGDTHAFGTNGSLREELQSEFGEGTIHYFIGLVPLTEFLGLQIPSGTARPHLADSTQAAIAQDINSPGMFIHLNSHIPPSERTMRAWTAHWDGLVTLEEGQTKYNFSLEGEHFLCYSQKYRTQKSYVLASMENPFAQAVPWHFHVSGEVTISVRYDGSGIVREMEVLSATIDDRKTSMLFPGGEKMSLAEAQRRR